MKKLTVLFEKARAGGFWLWVLNRALQRAIPFNKPHKIVVSKITEHGLEVRIPYRRSNQNHIRGIHACGLATAAEFTSGLVLLSKLGAKEYRLIMESIEVKYHYQAKSTSMASFELSAERLANEVLEPMKTADSVYLRCEIPVVDADGKLVCTATTNWQIKPWSKVRTKV